MASASLLLLLDDITSVLDDIASLTKVATRKTAGVLGDDLALNAQQVAGVRADRELPVVWAVAKGSFLNKAILVPAALLIAAFLPWAITPLLMLGGAFLCYEGFEKIAHSLFRRDENERALRREKRAQALADPEINAVAMEKEKIRAAIRTDFVLSAEIIVITLGVVGGMGLLTQVTVLSGIAVLMTVGVYGLVAGIVKLDDAGLYLSQTTGDGGFARFSRASGRAILAAAPWLMRLLSLAGTTAMFLVGGGILSHGIAPLHRFIAELTAGMAPLPGTLLAVALDGVVGIVAGALLLAVLSAVRRLLPQRQALS